MDPLDTPSALKKQIEQLEALRSVLGDALTDAKKAELEDRRRVLIETAGGAVILGDVQAGGDVVGRDKIEVNLAVAPQDPPELLLAAYYRSLADECRRLPLGVIDTQFVRTADESTIPLPDIYVDLDVVAPAAPASDEGERAWALRLLRPEGAARQAVLTALAAPEGARAVLLGDAGSGKSTLVSYLTYLLATGSPEVPETLRGRLIVRLVLREVAARLIPAGSKSGTAEMLWDALREDISRRVGTEATRRLFSYLQGRLLKDGGVFLLDGLDEVPEAERRREVLLGAIRTLVATLPDAARLLVTARPYAYADKKWHLPGFPILALAPFSPEQVERFIERWYRAARQPMGWSEETAGTKGGQLRDAVRDRPYLGDLASRPLLLTLMATLHSSWGQLPDDRAQLYEEVVKLLLGRWQRAREASGPKGEPVAEPGISQALSVGEERIREALERLAFDVHERQRGRREREGPADISEGEVLVAFKPLLGEVKPELLLAYLRDRAGLLVAPREGAYAFPHRSFQEYLAACRLANSPDPAARLRDKAIEDTDWWREVFLLGVGKTRQGSLGNAAQVVNVLVPDGAGEVEDRQDLRFRLAVLAGQALLELRLAERAPGEAHYQALLKRTRGWLLIAIEEGRLAPRERLEAGDVLGRLGDPRFDEKHFHLPKRYRDSLEPLFGFVEVPAGAFTMGSAVGEELADDHERPDHALDLPTFHIARYPVTNAQYLCFVESSGYEVREYWTQEGWNWRQGAEPNLGPIGDKDLRQLFAEWLAKRPAEGRSKPYRWDQPPYNPATRPVVGVSWHEALAYCRWLTEQLKGPLGAKAVLAAGGRCIARLPTEAEWEKAARGMQPKRWPWNDEWREGYANTTEARLEQTSPVSLFPAGASAFGALDMAGNVWEWTSSRWGRTSIWKPDYRYPYRRDDGREASDGPDLRVARGGSWREPRQFARLAYRYRLVTDYFDAALGFRVVLSLANSES